MSEEIRRAIEELGFEQPMPVQEEVIPYLLGNRNDVIALAQTGTGKTAAFGIPVLQRTDSRVRQTQAIVLSPTRELCLQIADDLKDFSKYMDGIHIVPVYGGTSIENQIRSLKKGAQIIVATPGRLIDLMHRGVAKLEAVKNDPNVIGVVGANWLKEPSDSALSSFAGLDVRVMKVSRFSAPNELFVRPYQYYIATGEYPLLRSVYVVTTDPRVSSMVKNFYFFLTGQSGQLIICKSSQLLPHMPVQVKSVTVPD